MLCLLSLGAVAQKPMKVLDETAGRIRKMGDVNISFTATTFAGNTESGSTQGSMLLSGKRMQLTTPDMKTWYDGKTQWSMMAESGEVNVTNPTEKEMAAVNPYTFLSHYKKGYRLSMKETTLRGQQTYEVHMVATSQKNPAQEIYVNVSKSNYTPLCIRVRQDEEWNRITIHDLKGNMQTSDADFTFPKSEYTDVEIIDLR